MNPRPMFWLSIAFCLTIPSAAHASEKPAESQSANVHAPHGELAPRYRVTGVRASSTLATEIHCTNLEAAPLDLYADFYQFDGSHVCTTFSTIAPGGTRTLATAGSNAFAEDYTCTVAPSIGQGSAHISVGTVGAKFICSAEIVSIADDPPTTLGALDIWPTN